MVDLCEEILQISMLVNELPASLPQSGTGDEEPMMFFSLCRDMISRVSRNTSRPRKSHTYTYTFPGLPGDEAAADVEAEVGEKRKKVPLSAGSPVPLWSTMGTSIPDILACSFSRCKQLRTGSCSSPAARGPMETRGLRVQTAQRHRDQRATPNSSTWASPAELCLGWKIRTTLPTLQDNLTPGWPDMDKIRQADTSAKQMQAYFYNRRNGVKSLPPLCSGDTAHKTGWTEIVEYASCCPGCQLTITSCGDCTRSVLQKE